ncbi:MAG: DUF29 domain-containing protein [Cyanobacteriota bacterium]|nr:DUF29 domain-containing protein [Cyanobacteriota bacterium]
MTPALYDTDFNLWIEETAQSLKAGNFQELDLENLIEEIESMTRSDKREIVNRLKVLIMHLLKLRYQPHKKTRSWRTTINEQRDQIELVLEDSPSLKPYLASKLDDCYQKAKRDAIAETKLPASAFPPECPFTQEQILDPDYFPNA